MATEATQQLERRATIVKILREQAVGRQSDLVRLLHKLGHDATQSSVSRDLRELGVLKAGDRYVLMPELQERVNNFDALAGFVREIHVQVDDARLLQAGLSVDDVARTIAQARTAVGGHVVTKANAEFVVEVVNPEQDAGHDRFGLKSLEDLLIPALGKAACKLGDVARVTLGASARRGMLEKDGNEVVGGVVHLRFGHNPLEVTRAVKSRLQEIAEGLFGDARRIITIDFARFTEAHHINMLLGSPPGYIGYSERLPLHSLAQMPWCVLLCQNVDQCHPTFRTTLARALETGTFTDAAGKDLYVSDAVVLMTAPSVEYQVRTTGGNEVVIDNPADLPSPDKIEVIREPWMDISVVCPDRYIGAVMELVTGRRGEYKRMEYLQGAAGDSNGAAHTVKLERQVLLEYSIPLSEILVDFYDTRFELKLTDQEKGDLVAFLQAL